MRKFNLGDKIKVIGNCNGHGYEIGEEYTIERYDSYYTEPNENGYAYNLDVSVGSDVIREKDMELVKPKEPIITMGDDGVHIKATMKDELRITDLYPNMIKTKYYDLYVKGEWNNMKNEVLELWYTRKHSKIMEEYEEKEREFNNSKELVIKYKEIVERFENELEELYESEENQEQNYIINTMTNNLYEYNIDYKKLSNEFFEKYVIERNEKLHELNELRKEIDAQLSLSTDLEYQVEVLTRYSVLDKKTKKMVD